MADEVREEDEWLYGENVADDQIKIDPELANKLLQDEDEGAGGAKEVGSPGVRKTEVLEGTNEPEESGGGDEFVVSATEIEQDVQNGSDEDVETEDDDDDDSDDDGVQVVIGDLKAGAGAPGPAGFGSAQKRTGPPPDKKGKFSVEDFEAPGTINGAPALEFNIDSTEEKPWRKPGADITDYFNYGFTEETWRAYCDRQKRIRFETGAVLTNPMAKGQGEGDGAKFGVQSNIIFPKKFVQQPFVRKDGVGPNIMMQPKQEPKENTIQVRVINTVDRRDAARKGYDFPPTMLPPPFDMTRPPPPFRHPEYMGMGGPPPEFFNRPPPGYYEEEEEMPGYEEQQWMDSQWEMEGGIGPSSSVSVVPLTKAPAIPPPPGEADDDQNNDSTK